MSSPRRSVTAWERSPTARWSNLSQLPAADVTLTTEILDQIDELVPPGVTINPSDNSYGASELTPAARRR